MDLDNIRMPEISKDMGFGIESLFGGVGPIAPAKYLKCYITPGVFLLGQKHSSQAAVRECFPEGVGTNFLPNEGIGRNLCLERKCARSGRRCPEKTVPGCRVVGKE